MYIRARPSHVREPAQYNVLSQGRGETSPLDARESIEDSTAELSGPLTLALRIIPRCMMALDD